MKSEKNNQSTDLQLSSAEERPNFVIFKTSTGKVHIDIFFHNETLWLTQKKLAEPFEKNRSVITKHIKIYFQIESLLRIQYVQKMLG